MSLKMDTHSDKVDPPGLTTTAANMAQKEIGDRETLTTNQPNARPGETMLSNQWFGKGGKWTEQFYSDSTSVLCCQRAFQSPNT